MAMVIYQRDALQQRRPGHSTPPTPAKASRRAIWPQRSCASTRTARASRLTNVTERCVRVKMLILVTWRGHVPPRGRGVRRVIWTSMLRT